MVPDKFNMVDMDGIDLIMAQGEEVPGLYNRLVESIAQCRYQCLYNWFFDGVVIPPSYVEMEVNEDDEVAINEGVTVSADDVIHIYSLGPSPVEPEIIPLLAEENGAYNVPAGKDGFNPVTVDVPSYTPVIEALSVTENGTYPAPSGVDGYSPVTVNVSGGSDYPVIDAVFDNSISGYIINISHNLVAPTSVSPAISQAINSYFTTMLKDLNGDRGSGNISIRLTEAIASMAVSSFEDAGYFNAPGMEYKGAVYGNAMIGTLGLVLLGDFSQGGAAQGNTLLDSINNYSGVIIQGIYNQQRTSGYNTSCLYPNISLNTAYWGGMQDRNGNYECKVTFTNDVTVSLSGNRQTIIYGIP